MTIWVPELDRSKPLYLAIADAMMRDVQSGTLATGTRLPPQRELAWKLGVTLGTVTRAYKEAGARGLLEGEVGRGSFVRKPAHVAAMAPVEADGMADLSHAVPPPVVKAEELDAAMQSILRDGRRLELLDYAPPEGFHLHRAMAAQWLARSGITVNEQDVMISAGAHLGLSTVLEAIGNVGDAVMAERVNYALLRTTFCNARLEPMAIDMDEEGLLPQALEQAARSGKARIVYLVPTLQNPTTHTMSRRRREDIVEVARAFDLTILEDDIFRLLDSRVQPPTFYELAPERTFHITGLSKTLAPGLRIGFVVSPRGQNRLLASHVRNMAARTAGLTGEIARYWIESGMADTILERVRQELAGRRTLLMDVLKGLSLRCAPGAPFAWLEVPEQWTPARFAQALGARQVRVTPGAAFDLVTGAAPARHVRVCLGHPRSTAQVRQALDTIREVARQDDDYDFTPVA